MRLFRKRDPFDDLMTDLAREIETALHGARVERDGETLEVYADAGSGPARLHPRDFADGLLDLPDDERRLATSALVRSLLVGPSGRCIDELSPHFRPAVRAWSWSAADPGDVASHAVVPFVDRLIAIDDALSMRFVTADDLDRWGADFDAVWTRAVANFEQLHVDLSPVAGYRALGRVRGPEAYVSSILLFPDRLAELGRRLPGNADRVVMAPTPDEVFVAAVDDDQSIEALLHLGEQRLEHDPRALSPVLYLIGEDGLIEWQPSADHPLAACVARSRAMLAGTEYAAQQAQLEERFDRERRDVFVATLMVFQPSKAAPIATGTTWSEGVTDALIPRADFVVFTFEGDEPFAVRWADVLEIAGDWLIREDDFGLPRWRYVALPDTPHLAALRQRAVPLD